MSESAQIQVLVLVRDLIFSSRISAEARAAGVTHKIVRDPALLTAGDSATQFLLVDLNLEGAIEAAAAWRKLTGRPVIGFVSHVDSGTITKARAAGIDQVQARSEFVRTLARRLQSASMEKTSPLE